MTRSTVGRMCGALLIMVLLTAGCQDKQQSNRQARLIADENHKLKSQLSKMTAQYDTASKDLEQCNTEKVRIQKEAEESVNFAMTTVMEEGKKELEGLQKENQELKAQIEQLKSPQSK